MADDFSAVAVPGASRRRRPCRLINREKAVLIDVSEPAEFAGGHAAGSKNVPLGRLEASGDLPKNKTLPLVVVCPSGTRAVRAVRDAEEARLRELARARRRPGRLARSQPAASRRTPEDAPCQP